MRNTHISIIALFTLLTNAAPLCAVTEVSTFAFGRSAVYQQTGISAVSLISPGNYDNPYNVEISVEESGNASNFTSGTLAMPSSSSVYSSSPLSITHEDSSWYLEGGFNSLVNINAATPAATYTVSMVKSGGGTTTVDFVLTTDALIFPTAPVTTSYTAMQSANATAAITINWTAWAAGTANDFILVEIDNSGNEVYSSPMPMKEGALTGTATSVTIPANTLSSGSTYTVSISFLKIISASEGGAISDFPNAFKAIYSQSRTEIPLVTTGQTPLDALLSFTIWNNTTWTLNSVNNTMSGLSSLPGAASEQIIFSIAAASYVGTGNVLFTGPAGSLLSNTAAGSFYNNDGKYSYSISSITPYLADGSYSVSYNSTVYSDSSIDYAPQPGNHVLLAATLVVSDGKIQTLSWVPYLAGNLTTPLDISSNDAEITVQLQDANMNNLYDNYGISTGTTSIDLGGEDISIYDINSIYLCYQGDKNSAGTRNNIFTKYFVNVSAQASIFDNYDHYDSWIPPYASDIDSFGWISDLEYPWVYSASLDILNNEGSYLGDGDGWMYIYRGGNITDGFYFYNYATHSWCWTNYNWHGWVYNYGLDSNSNVIGWQDITPEYS